MSEALTEQVLEKLIKSAGYHQEPLRVTHDFFSEVRRVTPGLQMPPSLPVGPEVVVVTDGSENVKLVDGVWTFVPGAAEPLRYHGDAS